jgi:hypothetical protein
MPDLATASGPNEWSHILEPGEAILWQGRPSSRVRLEFQNGFEPVVALLFMGFGSSWLWWPEKDGLVTRAMGLGLFLIGVFSLAGIHFWRVYVRARTSYALTDRRALIATATFLRRSVKGYPIGPESVIEVRGGATGSVFFATEVTDDPEGGVNRTRIGFEMIEECRAVLSRIRELQRKP